MTALNVIVVFLSAVLLIFMGIAYGYSLHRNNKIETGQRSLGKSRRFPPHSNPGANIEIYAISYLSVLVIIIILL